MNDAVEISLDAAKAILPLLDEQLKQKRTQADTLNHEIDELQKTIAELRAKITNSILPLEGGGRLRKRKPKGFAAKTIAEVLIQAPGLQMHEIEKRTGIDRSTIYRTLKDPLRNKGRFNESSDGQWFVSDLKA